MNEVLFLSQCTYTSRILPCRRPLLFTAFTAVLVLAGCVSENEIRQCVTPIEVGITQPDDGREYLQGESLTIEANIRSLCGSDYLDNAIYVFTSDVDGELGGQVEMSDGVLHFHSEQLLALGGHTITVRADSENSASGEGLVSIVVLENLPPAVELLTPNPEANEFLISEGVAISAQVTDPAEALDSLTLQWSLNGLPLDEGPQHADPAGQVVWTMTNSQIGCHELKVTVTDSLAQQATDTAELILGNEPNDLSAYQWWQDGDGDGYGNPAGAVTGCESPGNGWLNPTQIDCEDSDAEVHPGRADYCGDGLDSDCSPHTPAGCFPTGNVPISLSDAYRATPSPFAKGAGDVNGDGYADIALGGQQGELQIINGPVLGELNTDQQFISNNRPDHPIGILGVTVSGKFDFNGDGKDDMLLGNPYWGIRGMNWCTDTAGVVHLQLGASDLSGGSIEPFLPVTLSEMDSSDNLSLRGPGQEGACGFNSYLGSASTWLPDLDGDSIPDFALAAAEDQDGEAGAVYLYLSSDAAGITAGPVAASGYRLKIEGPDAQSRLGGSLGSADVDGDGISDLLIGSIPDDETSGGLVYVVFGRDVPPAQADVPISTVAGLTFYGANTGARAGAWVAGVGDLDGDGDEEFLVSAPGERNGDGVVYLVPGFYEVNGSYSLEESFSEVTSPGARGAVRFVGGSGEALNLARSAGDMNGDGYGDFLMSGAYYSGVVGSGGAGYLVYGGPDHLSEFWDPLSGEPIDELSMESLVSEGVSAARLYSEIGQLMGSDVDALGDVNGDGYDDVILSGDYTVGSVRVFFGGGT